MFLSDTAGERDGWEIWRREQSRIETSHYSLCVSPRAPERTGKKIITIIDPCIDSQLQMTLYSPIHQRLCDNGAVLVFQRCFTLPSVWSLTEPLACTDLSVVDSLLSKHWNSSYNSTLTDSLTGGLSSHTSLHTRLIE